MKWLFGMGLAVVSSTAASQNTLDFRLVSGAYEVEEGADELEAEGGVGFNLKGQFHVNERLFIRANYLTAEPDEVEINGQDLDGVELEGTFFRVGLGLGGVNENLRYYGALEFGDVELELSGSGGSVASDDNGLVVSVGLGDNGETAFLWEVELGLVQFDEVDGGSFEFALGYRVNEQVAILLSGQSYAVEDDVAEYTLGHGMLGVRIGF
ncbi:hypothetical protein [Algiphilus sp.]|uniref:hypothetical protein n=1 Tax=Algiphilus sp. TaxID=1872431 RepID=UPI003B517D8D